MHFVISGLPKKTVRVPTALASAIFMVFRLYMESNGHIFVLLGDNQKPHLLNASGELTPAELPRKGVEVLIEGRNTQPNDVPVRLLNHCTLERLTEAMQLFFEPYRIRSFRITARRVH